MFMFLIMYSIVFNVMSQLPTKSITALASGSDPSDVPQYVFSQLSNDTPTTEETNNTKHINTKL